MRTLIFLFSCFLLFSGCEEEDNSSVEPAEEQENVNDPDLTGYWINQSQSWDTLWIKDSLIFRSSGIDSSLTFAHKYEYLIKKDSIWVNYFGPDKQLYVPPVTLKYNLLNNDQLLHIENFDTVYPQYKGNKFEFIKKLNRDESCFNFDNDTIDLKLKNTWIFLGFKTDNREDECKPQEIREMYIEFRDTNKLYARSSCNDFEGKYSVLANDSLNIYNLGSTYMECPNDTVMDWEQKYFNNLKGAYRYTINGNKLTVSSESNIDLIFKAK